MFPNTGLEVRFELQLQKNDSFPVRPKFDVKTEPIFVDGTKDR